MTTAISRDAEKNWFFNGRARRGDLLMTIFPPFPLKYFCWQLGAIQTCKCQIPKDMFYWLETYYCVHRMQFMTSGPCGFKVDRLCFLGHFEWHHMWYVICAKNIAPLMVLIVIWRSLSIVKWISKDYPRVPCGFHKSLRIFSFAAYYVIQSKSEHHSLTQRQKQKWISQKRLWIALGLLDFTGCILIALLISSSLESEQVWAIVWDTKTAKESRYHEHDFESPRL